MLIRDGYHNYLNDRETEWPNPYTENRHPRIPRLSPDHGNRHVAQGVSQGFEQYQATHQTVPLHFSKAKRSDTQPVKYNQTAQWLTLVPGDTGNPGNTATRETMPKPPQGRLYRQVEDPDSMPRPKQRKSQSRKQKRFASQKYASHIDQYPLQEYTAGRVTRQDGDYSGRHHLDAVPGWEANPRGAAEAWGTSLHRDRDNLHGLRHGESSPTRDGRARKAYDNKSYQTGARNEDIHTDFQNQRAAYFDSQIGEILDRTLSETLHREQMNYTSGSRGSMEDVVVTPETREYRYGTRQLYPGHRTARQTLDFHDNAGPLQNLEQTPSEESIGNISNRSNRLETGLSGSGDIQEMERNTSAASERELPEPGPGFVRGMARMFDETNILGQRIHPSQEGGVRDTLAVNSLDPLATGSQRRRTGRTPKQQSNGDLWRPEEYFTED